MACNHQATPASQQKIPANPTEVIKIPALLTLPEVNRPELPLTGIEISAITSSGGLDQIGQLGTYWVRRNLVTWALVEPQEGERHWEQLAGLEEELIRATEKQLQVILVVRGTPEWAQSLPGSQCGPIKPEKLPAFASFLHDMVQRYSLPPYQVSYWELGNEPDVDPGLISGDSNFGCWGQAGDAYYGGYLYAEMLKLAYPQIKAASAQAQVLVGGLLLDCDPNDPPPGRVCDPSRYLEGILKNDGGDYFDGISFHAYDYYMGGFNWSNENWNSNSATYGAVLGVKARYLRSLLETYKYPEKYLLNTEAGLLCGRSGDEAECQEQVFQLTKAYYVSIANAAAAAEGLLANVWHSLLGWRGSGLVTADFQPLPAFNALRFSSQMLNGAAFVRTLDITTQVIAYEFLREGERFWLLWSLNGRTYSLDLPSPPKEVYDTFGVTLNTTKNIEVSPAPVYIVLP